MLILDSLFIKNNEAKSIEIPIFHGEDITGEKSFIVYPNIYHFPNDRYLLSSKYKSFFFKVSNICNTILDILNKSGEDTGLSRRLRTRTNGFTREEIIHLLTLGLSDDDIDGKSGYINYNYRFIPVHSAKNMKKLINVIKYNSSFYSPDNTGDSTINPDKIFSIFINKDFDLTDDEVFLEVTIQICLLIFETELIDTLQIPTECTENGTYIVISDSRNYYPSATFILEYYLVLYLIIIYLFDSMNVRFDSFYQMNEKIDTRCIAPRLYYPNVYATSLYEFAYNIYYSCPRNNGCNTEISDFCQTDKFYNLVKDIIEQNFDNSIW